MDRDYEEELGEVEELGEQEEQNAEQFAQRLPERRKEEPPPPTEVDSKKKLKGKRKKQLPPIRINLSACKYEVLRIVQRKLGWKEVGDDEDWELYWTDTSVSIERIMKLTRVQKINHFSGMLEICRKRAMARNLMKMARHFPQHYDFFPRTFTLPTDREEFMADIRSRGKKQVYILKPDAGCQGRGIRLVQGGKEEVVTRVLNEMATPNIVAQHYLVNPLLIHGYKFDLRIYALVLSCDPMRVFLFHEGLARFCTEKYSPPKASNLDVAFMHLTNYAVNKKNEAFVAASAANDEEGDASKWCLAQLKHYINSTGHSYDQVWGDIADLIIKSLCSVQPILRNNYRSVLPPDNDGFSCFEILGYDVMLDDAYRPWLIEVNHSPSFNIDSPLDLTIKEELITQTIELVRVDPKLIAKTKKAERRAATSRLLEPMHVKKAPPVRSGGPLGGAGGAGGGAGAGGGGAGAGAAGGGDKGEARDKGEREKGGGGTGAGDGEEASAGPGAGAAQSAAQSAAFVKPRTPEEYEAWRAKVLAARERYEAKHSGNFTRIFPSPDPAKQALYEELLKGANEVYQASFQARSKPAPSDDKKRKEDTETESQKAERLKQRALRDKLAQMAVERRRIKAQQQAQQQQAQQAQQPPLPAYLNPPPYMGPMGAGPYAPGGYPPGQLTAQPPHYVPLMPAGYQYDAALLYQQYHQQYGGGARGSEVYGERSDGAGSAASSRPVSALSTGGPAQDYLASAVQQHMQAAGGRLYSGHVARSAAGAGGNGGGSRSGSPANGGRTSAHHQHPHQVSAAQLLAHHQQQQQLALNQQLQTQGALPPHPFLGAPRRPASAASRAGGGGGAGGTAGASEGGDWPGTGAGLGPDLVATGRGASASGARAASPAPGFAPGGPAGGGGAGGAGRALGVGAVSGSGGADRAALLQLQQLQQAAAALSHPHPGGAVSAAGSARGHVRHAHSSALEAAGAAGERYPDLGSGSGEAGYGPGPGRGLGLTGSRPPSASASLRDKLQPGAAGATAAAVAAAALASVGVAGSHKHLAAAFWDGGMGAASTAAGGHDGGTAMPHLNSRPRPLSAGNGLRPTSSGGARRSPSPLGGLPPPLVGTGGGGYTSADMHLLGMLGHAPHMLMPQGMGGPGPGPLMVGPVASSKLIRSTSNPPAPTSPGSGTLPAAAGALAAPGSAGEGPGAASSSGRVYKTARAPAAVPLALTARGAASQALRRGEDDYLPTDDGSGPGVMYQPLSMPDAGAGPPPGMAYGGGPGAGGGAGRHWSAASHAGAQRQRSFTSGSTSGAAAAAAAAAAAGSGAAGHGGVSGAGPGTRLPVYPAPGGSPGMRPGGGPGSGRAGGGSPAGVGKGGPSGAAARLNTALAAAASGPGAHAVGLGYATGPGRGGGAGMVAGVGVGVGALQAGIEGLSFTAAGLSPGLDLDSQLRNAALASLNRKALTVTGRRVAQQ